MDGEVPPLHDPYAKALRDYVDDVDEVGDGEVALSRVRVLGRECLESGAGVRQLVAAHLAALTALPPGASETARRRQRASRFLDEALGPFDEAVAVRFSGDSVPESRSQGSQARSPNPDPDPPPATLVEARELAASLREEARTGAALSEIGRIIASSLDIHEVFEQFADEARRLLWFDRLDIVTVDLPANTFADLYVSDRESPGWRAGEVHTLSGTLYGDVVAKRDGIVLTGGSSADTDPQPDAFPARFPSLLMAPLTWRDTVVGILTLRAVRPGVYSENDLALVCRVAPHVAGAVANSQLYEQSLQLASERELRAKLDSENRELARALEAKTRLFSTVSHELKTPLASLVACTDLLTGGQAAEPTERQTKLASMMQRNLRQLNVLINDLVDSSHLAEGALELARSWFDMRRLCEETRETLEPILGAKRQTLRLAGPEQETLVWADRDRMLQIISNLVSNASKYSADATVIDLRLRRSRDLLFASVQDRGIGMSRADQAQVFEPFFRGEDEAVQAVGGSGLGLHIARQLIQLHGGDIVVESKPGVGTTVTFYLPISM
jgi:nitrogen-specific signal transduction histidine kinase